MLAELKVSRMAGQSVALLAHLKVAQRVDQKGIETADQWARLTAERKAAQMVSR